MKKILFYIFVLVFSLNCSAQTWNFTSVGGADKALMDAANHNPSYIAAEQEIKDVADKTIRVLEYIFEKYPNDKNKNTTQVSTNPA